MEEEQKETKEAARERIIDGYVGRHLRPHTKERANLVAQLNPTDSRGRSRGITCAKALIRSRGYSIRESNDGAGRYIVIGHTVESSRRMRKRLSELCD